MRGLYGLAVWCVVVALVPGVVRAEDFSVDLDRLVEADAKRPIPKYKLDRVRVRPDLRGSPDMPEEHFDVFIRFEKFGDVRLAQGLEAGPATGKGWWRKGMTFVEGLAFLDDVKVAWVKNSPDLFAVAWVDEPDGRGTGRVYGHGYVVLQLKDRRARVLLRGQNTITARVIGGVQEGTLTRSLFSFDPKGGLLEERVRRSYELASDRRRPLGRLQTDEAGEKFFLTTINETITVKYKLLKGRLVPRSCGLVYKTRDDDLLSGVARFYLGPFASRQILLAVNPGLAARCKGVHPGAFIYLKAGEKIRVPVPESWLMDKFTHRLARKQAAVSRAASSQTATQ
jgi:hypothetical protein